MSCCNTYNPCKSNNLSQVSSYAATAGQYAQQAQQSATNAATSATQASTAEAQAEQYAIQAAASAAISGIYLGAKSTAPVVDNQGNPLQEGMQYFNSVDNTMYVWDGTSWITATGFNETTSFFATGTTTPRNLVTRMADVVNVKDFGAVGDGVADDTAAIQAAIDYTQTLPTGGRVFIPQGNYRIYSQINISEDRIHIEGAGVGATQISIHSSSASSTVFYFNKPADNIYYCSVTNMTLSNGATSSVGNVIHATNATDFKFENLVITGARNGVYLNGCGRILFDTILVRNNNVPGTYNAGFIFDSPGSVRRCSDIHLDNIQMHEIGSQYSYGILVKGIDGLYISNSHFNSCAQELAIIPDDIGKNNIVASIHVSNTYFDGDDVDTHVFVSGTASNSYRKFLFTNCQFRNSIEDSILVNTSSVSESLIFSNCIFDSSVKAALYLTSTTFTDINVDGCKFENNNTSNLSTRGDIVVAADSFRVSDCIFDGGGPSGHCVYVSGGGTSAIITGNNFVGSTVTTKINTTTGAIIRSNQGFVTENTGTATVLSASTSVVVNHGLNVTPSIYDISVTPRSNFATRSCTSFWVSAVSSTTFTISLDVAPGDDTIFSWQAMSYRI